MSSPGAAAERPLDACPCGTGTPYEQCCGRFHRGAPAVTAELLMRSRYSAFVLRDGDHLRRSWSPETCPGHITFVDGLRWTALHVLATSGGGVLDDRGTVTFDAHYEQGGRAHVLHEDSVFVRHDGRWVYLGPLR